MYPQNRLTPLQKSAIVRAHHEHGGKERYGWMPASESFDTYKELIETGFFRDKSAELRYMLEIMESSRHMTHEQCEELRGLVPPQQPKHSEQSD